MPPPQYPSPMADAATPTLQLRVGERVGIEGLQARPDLNGMEAEVLLQGAERVGVKILCSGEAVRIRPINLRLLPGIWERLGGNEELMGVILHHSTVVSLVQAKAADKTCCCLCRLSLAAQPTRELFEYEIQQQYSHSSQVGCRQPSTNAKLLVDRAVAADFVNDTEAEWRAGTPSLVRSVRPPAASFRVGDIYFNGNTGGLGIVLGWDDRRKVPKSMWKKLELNNWGDGGPECIYEVHYTVHEVLDNWDEPGLCPLLTGRWARGKLGYKTNYVMEGEFHLPGGPRKIHAMLSFEEVCSGVLPWGQTKTSYSAVAAAIYQQFASGRSLGERQENALRQLWRTAPTAWADPVFAARFGFLPRHSDLCSSTRERERGGGFLPDVELQSRYPVDGPYVTNTEFSQLTIK